MVSSAIFRSWREEFHGKPIVSRLHALFHFSDQGDIITTGGWARFFRFDFVNKFMLYFWVSKKPKQVLKKDWISSSSNIKESGIKMSIEQNHGNSCSQNRKGSKKHKDSHHHAVQIQIKVIHGETLRAIHQNCSQKVYGP